MNDGETNVLDFFTKHFLVLSLALLLSAAALSMLFLVGYLSVFDWNLIWLVEYTDLTKLFLVMAALTMVVFSASSFVLMNVDVVIKLNVSRKIWFAVFCVIVLLVVIALIVHVFPNLSSVPRFYLFLTNSIVTVILMFFLFSMTLRRWSTFSSLAVIAQTGLFAGTIGLLGVTFGYYVSDESQSLQDVSTKDAKYTDSKIIMMLSHHVAFVSLGRVIVVPTSDVTKITSQAPPPK